MLNMYEFEDNLVTFLFLDRILSFDGQIYFTSEKLEIQNIPALEKLRSLASLVFLLNLVQVLLEFFIVDEIMHD